MEIINQPGQDAENRLSFGEVFRESQELYTKVVGLGALTVMIYLIASGIVGFVFESVTGLNRLTQQLTEDIERSGDIGLIWQKSMEFYSDNAGIALLTRFGTDLILLLSFPLAGGFMLVCRQMDTEGTASFSKLFEGFKPEYWGRLMLLSLTYYLLSKIGLLLFVIPGIYIWVAAVLACPFVMFGSRGGIDALRSSIERVNKNWFEVFKILFVATLIGWLGYLVCGVGRIFSYPFVLVTIYVLYKQMVGFADDRIYQIGKE